MTENNEKQDPWCYWWIVLLLIFGGAIAMGVDMLMKGINGGP